MARSTKSKPASSGARAGLRTRKTIEYNVQKLSDASVFVPKAPKKPAAPKKKGGGKKKKSGATYLVLIKRALKNVDAPGLGLESIMKYLAANYPDKNNRRHVRLALSSGVDRKVFVKTRASWRLSKKAQERMSRSTPKTGTKKSGTKKATKKSATKKATTKKSTTKKATTKKATTKKATKKSTTEKATTKKSTTKKATTKKATPKKTSTKKEGTKEKADTKKRAAEEEAPKSPAKKKVIGPPAGDDTGAVSEAIGKWQYYDGGWQNYTDDASRIVEGVYQEYKFDTAIHVRPIQSGHFSYSVNFQTMEQTNTSTGTMRKIRRI